MEFRRSTGVLVHPTSFPSPYGMGDLGPAAYRFIDFLVDTDQSVWQLLPVGPTGYGNSPYASYSAFAGNHYLISPELLVEEGLIRQEEARMETLPSGDKADYETAFYIKGRLLEIAENRFRERRDAFLEEQFRHFCRKNEGWLPDYALFMACSEHHQYRPWNQWEAGLKNRRKNALETCRKQLAGRIAYHEWCQFEFFRQWEALRNYANDRGLMVIGDIPIFVDHNSADVWAHSHLFEVDKEGSRVLVSGVPPDYFSNTGQLWGNPLYRWETMEKNGFEWWIRRFEQMFSLFDAVRVDHFRGFEAYWEVRAGEDTAVNGRWVKGPGEKLFNTIRERLGDLPIIAEDLGVLTREVIRLRDSYHFPGMKILQFAFSDNAANGYLPHNYKTNNCIVYTGTHDNDTTIGWYRKGSELERHHVREYLQCDGQQIHWDMIRLGMLSVADLAIFPLQDYMGLDTRHRMNFPGTASGNWEWRYTDEMLHQVDRDRIRHLVKLSNRNVKNGEQDANLVSIRAEGIDNL